MEYAQILWSAILLGLVLLACDSVEPDPLDEIRKMQATGQAEASIPVLQALIESGDRRGEVFLRYGKALTAIGQYGRAVWPLDAAAEDPEFVVVAARELARNAYSTGNFELALQTLARLRDTRTDGLEDEDYGAMLLEARSYIETRRHYEEAIEILDRVIEFDVVRDQALRLKAAALLGLDRIDEAYDIIRETELVSGEEDDSPEGGPKRDESYWCAIELSFHRESDEIEKAEKLIEDCLERFPTSVGIIDEAIKIYARQGRPEAALEILRLAYESAPGDRRVRFPFVLQLREMGQFSEAEAILQTATETLRGSEEPDLSELAGAWVDLGGLLADQDKLDEALDAYAEAILLLGDTVTPNVLFTQAELMIRAERYEDALEIAETTPVEVHGPMLRGRIAFERGDLGQALAELDMAALLWPDNAPIRYYLARASEGLGEFDRAVEEYRQAMRSDPNLEAARVRLARLHLAEGRVLQARDVMRFSSSSSKSWSLDAVLVEIEIQAATGTLADLNKVPIDLKRSSEESRRLVSLALSRGLRAGSGPKVAAKTLGKLQEKALGPYSGLFFRERVENLLEAGEIERAAGLSSDAVADRPDDLNAQIALARVLRESEDRRGEAITILSHVFSKQPRDAEVLAWLGDLELMSGNPNESIQHFEAALAITPDSHDALIGLTRALVSVEQPIEARRRLEFYLAFDNPIDGVAALELAMMIEKSQSTKNRRIALGRRAFRFGAGQAAVDFLAGIDQDLDVRNKAER